MGIWDNRYVRGATKVAAYGINPVGAFIADRNDLASKAVDPNYDLVPGVTVSNRPGQVDINPTNNNVKGASTSGGNIATWGTGAGGAGGGGGGGGTSSYSTTSGGGGGVTSPSYSQQDLDYLNSQQSLYERLLADTDSFQSSGLNKLSDSYNTESNKANLSRGRALEDYQTQREDSARGKQQAVGAVNTNARTLSDSLRRILGMAAGSGSSAYRYAAPNAVARQASQQRSNVMNKYGENERDLATSENRATTDFDNLLSDIFRQKQEGEESLRTGFDTQRQGINQSLAEIAAERASLLGGNPLDAARPYQDRYLGLQSNLTNYPNQFRTAVTPKAVEVKPVSLRDYVVDRQSINANKSMGETQYSPYSQFIRQRDEEEQLV